MSTVWYTCSSYREEISGRGEEEYAHLSGATLLSGFRLHSPPHSPTSTRSALSGYLDLYPCRHGEQNFLDTANVSDQAIGENQDSELNPANPVRNMMPFLHPIYRERCCVVRARRCHFPLLDRKPRRTHPLERCRGYSHSDSVS